MAVSYAVIAPHREKGSNNTKRVLKDLEGEERDSTRP
jgi:hypothetical protein